MAILDIVEGGHARVGELRSELDRVREALDRTDAVLGVTDDALVKAESAIERGRRWAPVVVAIGAGLVVGAIGVLVLVRRRRRQRAALD